MNCDNCHKEFKREACQLRGKKRYCSRECVWEAKKYYKYKHGEFHHNWKGGRRINQDGYVLLHRPDHPFAESGGHVMEHRLVMEMKLGRYLSREEVVDHLNGKRDDNRIENLQLMESQSQHIKLETKRGKYKKVLINRKRDKLGKLL